MSHLTLNYTDALTMTPDLAGRASWIYTKQVPEFTFNGRNRGLVDQFGRALATFEQWEIRVIWENNPDFVEQAQKNAEKLNAKFAGNVPFESTAQSPATHLMRGYGLVNALTGRRIAVMVGWQLVEDGSGTGKRNITPEVYEWKDGGWRFHEVTRTSRESIVRCAKQNGDDWQFDRENAPWTKYHFIARLLLGAKIYYRVRVTDDEIAAAEGNGGQQVVRAVRNAVTAEFAPKLMDSFRRETLTHVCDMPYQEVHSFLHEHDLA